jgi:tetratricopeptide (TPR) repeat protein
MAEAAGDPGEVESALRGARDIFQRLAGDHPGTREYHQYLAESCVRLGALLQDSGKEDEGKAELHEACAVLKRMTDEYGNSIACYHHLAVIQMLIEDTEGYRQTCADAVGRFLGADEPVIGGALVSTCVLGADAVDDLGQIVEIARRGVETDGADGRRSLGLLGAALYRAGHFAAAVTPLSRSAGIHENDAVFEHLYLSLARHRLGETEEAQACLEKAIGYLESSSPRMPTNSVATAQWGAREESDDVGLYAELQTQILLREVSRIVKSFSKTAR